ncbi:MAG: hypothetical protein LBK67_03240 [Coriobacteriales bacterium]|nr:hypothetical protein [Coriobacteriales bacterium]
MDRKKRFLIAISAVALVALFLVALFFLRIAPEGVSSQGPANESQTDGQGAFTSTDVEGEHKADPGSGTLPELDLEGIIAVSGEFDYNSVQGEVDLSLSEVADEFAPVIEAIKSVDLEFGIDEGYVVRAHNVIGNVEEQPGGSVRLNIYIDDIKTSAGYTVKFKDGELESVSIRYAYHPDDATRQRILQLKSDFESSAAGKAAIERTKAAMWPAGSTATPDEYSEEYYFDFSEDRLYLIITDDRRIGDVIDARQEKIDCLEVLGR